MRYGMEENQKSHSSKYLKANVMLCEQGENQDKFSQKSNKGILLVGYSRRNKAYRVCLKEKQIIIESLHVDFGESIWTSDEEDGGEETTATPIRSS